MIKIKLSWYNGNIPWNDLQWQLHFQWIHLKVDFNSDCRPKTPSKGGPWAMSGIKNWAAAQRLQISDGTFEELRQDRLSNFAFVLTGPNATHV